MSASGGVRGHTLIEMAVVIAIAGILLGYAAHSYREWIANTQIRTAAETLVEGLSAARNEAIRRNRKIGFYLVSDLSDACKLSDTGTSWVVSVADPTSLCDTDMSESEAPQIVAKRAGSERTATVRIVATSSDDDAASSVSFDGVGRVVLGGTKSIARIVVDSLVLGDQARDLRIVLSPGGMIRMCDPDLKVGDEDTRKCP